jgi:hypothetical protein
MRRAVTARKLHHAQAVAFRAQAHRFGIDGDPVGEFQTGGQIALVEMDGHERSAIGTREVISRRGCRIGAAGGRETWCPREDSNFHDLSATRT